MGLFDKLKKITDAVGELEKAANKISGNNKPTSTPSSAPASKPAETAAPKPAANKPTVNTNVPGAAKVRIRGGADSFGLYANQNSSDNSWFNNTAYEENNLKKSGLDATEYFAQVYRMHLSDYEYKTDVSLESIAPGLGIDDTVDFVFYKGGRPIGAVLIKAYGGRNRHYYNVANACKKAGISFINFFTRMPNYESYVAGRTRDFLSAL